MYTTMDSASIDADFSDSDFKAPMAGFGYGLPLSRLVSSTSPPFFSNLTLGDSTHAILEVTSA